MLVHRLMRGTKEAQVALHFLYHQAREGIPWRRTPRQRRPGWWRLGRSAGGGRRSGGLAGPEGGGGPREEGKREQAGCKNFQGNDLGYQGESGRIDNVLWQILFTIFKQRFGF
jgi:hypothetical protein